MTDLQARLDRAITEADRALVQAFVAAYDAPDEAVAHAIGRREHFLGLLRHQAALVALRARLEEHRPPDHEPHDFFKSPAGIPCCRWHDLDAEAERLLEDA